MNTVNTSQRCPSVEELTSYGQGKLTGEALERIDRHVAACEPCAFRLEQVGDDSFIRRVRPRKVGKEPPSKVARPSRGTAADLPDGLTQLGNYRLLSRLGQGGMGTVYKAVDTSMRREVALKLIQTQGMGDPALVQRFKTEVRAAAQLEHANIVRAYYAELDQEPLYLVMELIDGFDLHGLVQRRGPLSVEQAVGCTCQAAKGLQHAHEKGLVHRDIKPQNLMVTRKNEVKILDFGLAKRRDTRRSTPGSTEMGVMMGTPHFMAPEQSKNARDVDIRADVYSLGCTLWFLLTGTPPFKGEQPLDVILAHHESDRPWLLERRPDAPKELAEVVRKMMAKGPGERYQTPAEVAKALQPYTAAGGKAVELGKSPSARSSKKGDSTQRTSRKAGEAPNPFALDEPTAAVVSPLRSGGRARKGMPSWVVYAALLTGLATAALASGIVLIWNGEGKKGEGDGKRAKVTSQTKTKSPEPGKGGGKGEDPDRRQAEPLPEAQVITNSIGMRLVRIRKGMFMMGSPADEEDRGEDEKQHEVEITRDFHLGEKEVTQEEYKKVMDKNPSWFSAMGGGKEEVGIDTSAFPVEMVSWEDAMEFCRKLTEKDRAAGKIGPGQKYRLPTEAEWEYACRAGSATAFHFGNWISSVQANFNSKFPYGTAARGDHLERTCEVGSNKYKPNAFGLYDMHGNVWEWCLDWYDKDYYANSPPRDPSGPSEGSFRVLRGGGWGSFGGSCRSAYRRWVAPGDRYRDYGFRVALVPTGEADDPFLQGTVWRARNPNGTVRAELTVLKREGTDLEIRYRGQAHWIVANAKLTAGVIRWGIESVTSVEKGEAFSAVIEPVEGSGKYKISWVLRDGSPGSVELTRESK
jgi:formylglycine-generating enzyme required for sulfatase activity